MASLKTFARRIRALGQQVEIGSDRLVRETAVVINQSVVTATPVQFGRARANWQANIGSPITEAIDELDPTGQRTIIRNNSTPV